MSRKCFVLSGIYAEVRSGERGWIRLSFLGPFPIVSNPEGEDIIKAVLKGWRDKYRLLGTGEVDQNGSCFFGVPLIHKIGFCERVVEAVSGLSLFFEFQETRWFSERLSISQETFVVNPSGSVVALPTHLTEKYPMSITPPS